MTLETYVGLDLVLVQERQEVREPEGQERAKVHELMDDQHTDTVLRTSQWMSESESE